MLSDFLKKYESDLKKYEREAVRMIATPLNSYPLEDEIELKDSKLLGTPFFPADIVYPEDKSGKPMILALQLNFEQVPHIENFPKDGILQLFLSPGNWHDEDYKIVYFGKEDLHRHPITDFSFLKPEDFEEMPIYKPHSLSFERMTDKGSSMDAQFDYLFDGMEYWDMIETLDEKQEAQVNDYFNASGHKLGGYAEFTQEDPRAGNSDIKNDIQLLQLDTDEEIMFGDGGIAHIFISKENLLNKDFSKAYFYWDCC